MLRLTRLRQGGTRSCDGPLGYGMHPIIRLYICDFQPVKPARPPMSGVVRAVRARSTASTRRVRTGRSCGASPAHRTRNRGLRLADRACALWFAGGVLTTNIGWVTLRLGGVVLICWYVIALLVLLASAKRQPWQFVSVGSLAIIAAWIVVFGGLPVLDRCVRGFQEDGGSARSHADHDQLSLSHLDRVPDRMPT